MKKDPKIFLEYILESIESIEDYLDAFSKKKFFDDQKTQDAVIRKIEIIGEAVKNLPLGFRNKHPEISWREIAGTRDIIVHEYFDIDLDLIWVIAKKDILKFKKQVLKLLKGFK